jgi:hypothetical protein
MPCDLLPQCASINLIIISFQSFRRETQNIGGFGEALHVDLFLPGAASLANHHCTLDNGKETRDFIV